MITEPCAFIKVKRTGSKRWEFVCPDYTTSHTKIYAAMITNHAEARAAVDRLASGGINIDNVRMDVNGRTVYRKAFAETA